MSNNQIILPIILIFEMTLVFFQLYVAYKNNKAKKFLIFFYKPLIVSREIILILIHKLYSYSTAIMSTSYPQSLDCKIEP